MTMTEEELFTEDPMFSSEGYRGTPADRSPMYCIRCGEFLPFDVATKRYLYQMDTFCPNCYGTIRNEYDYGVSLSPDSENLLDEERKAAQTPPLVGVS